MIERESTEREREREREEYREEERERWRRESKERYTDKSPLSLHLLHLRVDNLKSSSKVVSSLNLRNIFGFLKIVFW